MNRLNKTKFGIFISFEISLLQRDLFFRTFLCNEAGIKCRVVTLKVSLNDIIVQIFSDPLGSMNSFLVILNKDLLDGVNLT